LISLEAEVFAALTRALDSGYDMAALPVEEIAADLALYSKDFEKCGPAQLAPHIKAWVVEKNAAYELMTPEDALDWLYSISTE
jgi:hypothetical protein